MLREVEGGRARRVQSVQRRRQTRKSLPASRPRKAVFESLSSSEAAVELRPNKFLMNSSGLFSVLSTIFFLTQAGLPFVIGSMEAEFDRRDKAKNGQLDVKELAQSQLRVNHFSSVGK